MKHDKLNLSQEEFDICIGEFSDLNGYSVSHERKNTEFHYFIAPSDAPMATIRFQITKNGTSLSSALGKNQDLGDEFLSWMQENGYTDRRVLGGQARYSVPKAKRDTVRQRIEEVATAEEFTISFDDEPQHCEYRCRIKNQKHDIVTVSQFNTGSLLLQGRAWFVWDRICPAIEEELNCEVSDIVVRIVGDDSKADQLRFFTTDFTKASASARARLGPDAYTYLGEYDRKLLDSTEVLIYSDIEMPDYFPFIAPVCRAIEGYFKQVLVTQSAFRAHEVRGAQFKWIGREDDRVFKSLPDGTFDVVPTVAKKLGCHKNPVLKALLLEILDFMEKVRNHYFHSSPGKANAISDKRTALHQIEEAYRLIRESHALLFL
jgi:DNA-binding Xre family transcriptional regulator